MVRVIVYMDARALFSGKMSARFYVHLYVCTCGGAHMLRSHNL